MKVQIECCTNCSQHTWCSHHDQAKYKSYFQKIRAAIQQSLMSGQQIQVMQMQPNQYCKKKHDNQTDNRYIDERTGEQFNFPRIGSFQVYANGNLIFSKLKSHTWPDVPKLVKIITKIYNLKQAQLTIQNYINQTDSTFFRVSTAKPKTQSRHFSAGKTYRQPSSQKIQINIVQKQPLYHPSKQFIHSSLTNNQIYRFTKTQPKNILKTEKEIKFNQNNRADKPRFENIYMAAANQMKQFKKKRAASQKTLIDSKKTKNMIYPQLMKSQQALKIGNIIIHKQNNTEGNMNALICIQQNKRSSIKGERKSPYRNQQSPLLGRIKKKEKNSPVQQQKNDSYTVRMEKMILQKKKYQNMIEKQKNRQKKQQKINKDLDLDNNQISLIQKVVQKNDNNVKANNQDCQTKDNNKKQVIQAKSSIFDHNNDQIEQSRQKIQNFNQINKEESQIVNQLSENEQPAEYSLYNQTKQSKNKFQGSLQKRKLFKSRKSLQMQKQSQRQKKLSLLRQRQYERLSDNELQKYKVKVIEMQRQRQKQKQIEYQRAKMAEMQRQRIKKQKQQKQRQKRQQQEMNKKMQQIKKQKQIQRNTQRQRERIEQMNRLKQLQRQRQLQKQRIQLQQRQTARQRQRQAQKQEFQQLKRQQIAFQKQREIQQEMQRILQLQKDKHMKKLEQAQKQKQQMKQKQMAIQRQRQAEREELERLKKLQVEIQKERQCQRQRQRMIQLQREKEIETLRQAQEKRVEQLRQQKQMQLNKQRQLQKQLERYKMMQAVEKEKALSLQKQIKTVNPIKQQELQNNQYHQLVQSRISKKFQNSRKSENLLKSQPQNLPLIPEELINNLTRQRYTYQLINVQTNILKNWSQINSKNQSFRSNQFNCVRQECMPIPQTITSQLQKMNNINTLTKQKVLGDYYIDQFPKIKLEINQEFRLNPFIDKFRFENNIIQKIKGDGMWHCVKFQQISPNHGKYSVGFEIIKSKQNFIQIGYMPRDYNCPENKICDKAIGLNVAYGRLHDTCGDRNKTSTKWRPVFEPLQQNEKVLIEMCIDLDQNLIRWLLNGYEFARSVISNYLKGSRCVVYLSMFHTQDIILINPIPNKTAIDTKEKVELPNEVKKIDDNSNNILQPRQDEIKNASNLSKIQQDDKQQNDNQQSAIMKE